jgi:predicted ATPase
LDSAERGGDVFDLLSAHYEVGQLLFFAGNFARALEHFERSMELYDPSEHGTLAYAVGMDRGVNAHVYAAWCYLYRGHPDQALALSETTVALAKRLDHPLSVAIALFFAGVVHLQRGELGSLRRCSDETVSLAERFGLPLYLGLGRVLRGCSRVEAGEVEAGIAEMEQAVGELAGISSAIGAPQILCVLANALRAVGRHDDALGVLALAVRAPAEQQELHFYDSELHRLRADILLEAKSDAAEEAETLLGRSLEIARSQAAKTFELRAATSLARMWQRQGKLDAARALLAPLCAWFTEGFGTRDLREAKALLDSLGTGPVSNRLGA